MFRVKLMVALMAATALVGLALSYFAVQGAGGALATLGVEEPPEYYLPTR